MEEVMAQPEKALEIVADLMVQKSSSSLL